MEGSFFKVLMNIIYYIITKVFNNKTKKKSNSSGERNKLKNNKHAQIRSTVF